MYWLICFLTDRKCCNFVPQVKDTVICTSPPITPPQKTTTIQPRNICENCVFTNISERHSDLYIPPPHHTTTTTKKTIQPRNICFSQIFLKDTVICTSPPHHTTTTTTKTIQPRNICENCVFTNISERHSDLYIPPPPSHHHHHKKNYTTQKYL